MLEKLKSLLFYAGLNREDFNDLQPNVLRANAQSLKSCSSIAALVFVLLFVVTSVITSFADKNLMTYGIFAVVNLGLCLCARYVLPHFDALTMPMMYLFAAELYAFSLVVTALQAEYPSVSTIALLFAFPFIMIDRPIRTVPMTVLVVVCLCVLSLRVKSAALATTDIWNGISYGFVAIAIEVLVQRNMFRMLYQERKITRISRTDLLTGVNNRNHYEQQMPEYPWRCAHNLVCVYADANGLHELNNEYGHDAGDLLLIATAQALIEAFEKEHIYRVGGDEFICFDVDGHEEDVRERMLKVQQKLAEQGYDVSWGVAAAPKYSIDMKILTNKAEAEMYVAKRLYYQQSGHDRRQRRS